VEQRLHYLHMNGREVFKFAVRVFAKAAQEAITQAGISKEDIDLFVPHQANQRIIEAAAKRYALPMEKVVSNVERYANISAATIPVALQEAREAGRVKKGDHILMAAFGAGLTYAAAVVRWSL
jgi:3-oxoacyl-[acyl-carrier-protein] synthase-3